ncbi:MAG: MBL fold metallo-hydrolase, partial [Sphingobacteriales bacterium]
MELNFWGAARQVTGSMHMLTVGEYKILVDCGLDYEKDTSPEENTQFPFDPTDIDVVILTHAHIDHSGNLPTLVRMGFSGQILCTPPTSDLMSLLLMDSVNIFLSKQRGRGKGRRKQKSSMPPLYLQKHVMDTMDRVVTVGFHRPFTLNGDVSIEFIPVGHILGAAAVIITATEDGVTKKIGFTGDLGRKNYPVLRDPEPLPAVDYLVSESTYGGRNHTKGQTIEEKLTEIIEETCIKSPGRLIIPAFSIGRTQSLVFTLNKIFSSGALPTVKVFVDSPLANHATTVYRKYHVLLSDESQGFYKARGDEFEFDNLEYVQNLQESKQVANYMEPCIIISSAGMLEGGRIQDHLFYNIQNYYCTILFIGYCAKGTLGHRLLRGDPIVHLRDRELSVFATIKQTDLLSGHADHDDLMAMVANQPDTLQ